MHIAYQGYELEQLSRPNKSYLLPHAYAYPSHVLKEWSVYCPQTSIRSKSSLFFIIVERMD